MPIKIMGRAITPHNLEKGKAMNGYVCFYKDKRVEVYASTTSEAQKLAAQKQGQQVTHNPSTIG